MEDAWNAFEILTVRTISTANVPITHAPIPVSGIRVDLTPMEHLPGIFASANVSRDLLEILKQVAFNHQPHQDSEQISPDQSYKLTVLPMAFL
jgi:hypothetical protein